LKSGLNSLRSRLIIFGILFNSMTSVQALELLTPITVTPDQITYDQIINNSQLLSEGDLSIAHERSILDVIQGHPGVATTRLGGYGQPSGLLIRGTGGLGLITLDDIPLLNAVPGLFSFDTLPNEAIQSAKITRGVGAIDAPFQALGGAIQLHTKDRLDDGASLSLEGGSFGILRETLNAGLTGSLGRITATFSRGDAFEGNHLATSDKNPERETFQFNQGIMRFSSNLGKRLTWQGSGLFRNSKVGSDALGFDGSRVVFKDDPLGVGRAETWLAQNSLLAQLTPDWTSQIQLGFTQLNSSLSLGSSQNSLFNRLYIATLRNQHKLIDDQQQALGWHFNWGGQTRHEQGGSRTSGFDEERTLVAGFLETEARYRDVSGQVGVRVEHFDQYGSQPLFKSAVAWRITPALTLRASGGTGYRIPSYTELLTFYFGNLNLQPERSASGDLGFVWSPRKNLKIAVNGYYNCYDNLITQAYHPMRGPYTTNVPDTRVVGVEFDTHYAWNEYLDTGVSYTFSDSQNLQSNKLLPNRSPHIARIWGKQRFVGLPLSLWAEVVLRSKAWNDMENNLVINPAAQVNASIQYSVTESFQIYVRGENLSNDKTSQFYSIDTPGAAVYGGFHFELY
jgi:vitamin B12 transporter